MYFYSGFDLDGILDLRKFGLNCDIKYGRQLVIAPPSVHEKDTSFSYSWCDCDPTVIRQLPDFSETEFVRFVSSNARVAQSIPSQPIQADGFRSGSRGLALNDFLVSQAWACDVFDELLDLARSFNDDFANIGHEQLEDAEVISRATSVWEDLEKGKIERRVGMRATCTSDADEVRYFAALNTNGSDAFMLLQLLRAEHEARCRRGETFVLAIHAMVDQQVLGSWSARRYRSARDLLLHFGFIRCVKTPTRGRAAEYVISSRRPTRRL